MSISILVEPGVNGFRAATGGPFDLEVEADTSAQAVAALRAKIDERLRAGAVLIEQSVAPASPTSVIPLAENPMFDEWLQAVEDYRRGVDSSERAVEAD